MIMQSRIRWSSRKRVRVGIGVEERIQAGWPVNSPLSYPPSSTSQGYGEGHVLEHDKQITRFDCASINCCIGWIESIGISIGWVLFFEGLDNAIEDFPRSESTWKYYFFIFIKNSSLVFIYEPTRDTFRSIASWLFNCYFSGIAWINGILDCKTCENNGFF